MIQTQTLIETKILTVFFFPETHNRANDYLLPKVVQQHDVDIHVIQIIAIWGILLTGPEVRVKAFVRKHMATMFGFIINTIKASHLQEMRFTGISAFKKQTLMLLTLVSGLVCTKHLVSLLMRAVLLFCPSTTPCRQQQQHIFFEMLPKQQRSFQKLVLL